MVIFIINSDSGNNRSPSISYSSFQNQNKINLHKCPINLFLSPFFLFFCLFIFLTRVSFILGSLSSAIFRQRGYDKRSEQKEASSLSSHSVPSSSSSPLRCYLSPPLTRLFSPFSLFLLYSSVSPSNSAVSRYTADSFTVPVKMRGSACRRRANGFLSLMKKNTRFAPLDPWPN